MKKNYLVLLSLIFAGMLNAQSLQILTLNDVDVSGTEQNYTGDIEENINTIIEHFKIKNNSSSNIDVTVKKHYISILPETSNDFCWAGQCLPPSTMQSNILIVPAGTTEEPFDIHYHCQGIEGTSTVQYVAFDKSNPNDSVYFTVNFTAEVNAIENVNRTVLVSNVYPNPANNIAKLDFNLQANQKLQCDVYDILGKLVYNESVSGQGAIEIPVRKLPQGTYFCRLILDGKLVETQKLMIQ
ncbi:MAG: T9SS type A sorting domain-containing protein [Bacteroidota bacterium]|nr:T9SS type A sorting domain-containing protein [Bacteroidota bacterium]